MTGQAEEPKQNPLVATLRITPTAQAYFNELRQKHFPPDRNYLDAHLTLFHALPHQLRILEDVKRLAENQPVFEATARAIVSLGYGTAFRIEAPELPALHRELQACWADLLTNQDRQKRNFHITIQNKVLSETAKKLQAELANDFQPFHFSVTGICLWRYLGGPWEYLTKYDFQKKHTT